MTTKVVWVVPTQHITQRKEEKKQKEEQKDVNFPTLNTHKYRLTRQFNLDGRLRDVLT